jgi:putative membrane protein (TIGR04086 family)
MARRIIAMFTGFFIALALALIYHYWDVHIRWGLWFISVHYLLPVILGSLIAGSVARRDGWLYGLLVGVLFQTWGAFLFQHIIGDPWDWVIDSLFAMWYPYWAIRLGMLIAGVICGHFGQLLAQKWHRRSLKKPNASQSDN